MCKHAFAGQNTQLCLQVEGSSQTELKHPKNVYTQYEPRVFSEEEVEVIWNSDPMKLFLSRMDEV